MDSQRIDAKTSICFSPAKLPGWLSFLCCFVTLVAPVAANPPVSQLASVFPAGCQVGQEVLVKVSGSNLEGLAAIGCSHPGVTFQQQGKDQFKVTVAAETPTGIYDVYAVTSHGISSCRAFFVAAQLGQYGYHVGHKLAPHWLLGCQLQNGQQAAGAQQYRNSISNSLRNHSTISSLKKQEPR